MDIYHYKTISDESARKKYKKFEFKGIEEKFEILETQYSLNTDKAKYFKSINQARNCITHRGSIVGDADLNDEDAMKLKWLRMHLFVEKPDGVKVRLDPPMPAGGIYFEGGGQVAVGIEEKILEFRKGETVNLTPNDLSEVCYMAFIAIDDLIKTIQTLLYSSGIEIAEKKATS